MGELVILFFIVVVLPCGVIHTLCLIYKNIDWRIDWGRWKCRTEICETRPIICGTNALKNAGLENARLENKAQKIKTGKCGKNKLPVWLMYTVS